MSTDGGITYEEARLAVAEEIGVEPDGDSPYLPHWGYESDADWQVPVGPRAWLEDGDAESVPMSPDLYLVDKRTGAITTGTYLDLRERMSDMRPYGAGHPDAG
jgi:hypothetical protein